MPTLGLPSDAWIQPSLTADCWIVTGRLPQHDRALSHSGTEEDDDVVLVRAIGPYAAGTTLDVFLSGVWSLVSGLENANHAVALLYADAILSLASPDPGAPGTWLGFTSARAILFSVRAGSFTADVRLCATLTADASINGTVVRSIAASASIVDDVC